MYDMEVSGRYHFISLHRERQGVLMIFIFRLRSSSKYSSYRNIVFPAHVESSNVSVAIRQKKLYGIFLLQANNSEPANYSWSAALYKLYNEVFPKSVHILGMPVLYQLKSVVCDREGPGVDTGT